jgi:hypothetical protein
MSVIGRRPAKLRVSLIRIELVEVRRPGSLAKLDDGRYYHCQQDLCTDKEKEAAF